MQPISVLKGTITLAGLLFQPNTTTPAPNPAVVVVHPGGGVKEQTASIYASRLSQHGFITIAYDAAHQGDSDGEPRFLEDPSARVSDISAIVDYLERLDGVDPQRIVVVGICAGGGYGVAAATRDHRIRGAAIVSAVNIGLGQRLGWLGNQDPALGAARLDTAAENIRREAQGATPVELTYIPWLNDTSAPRDLQEAAEYYQTPRAQHPNARNVLLERSVPLLLPFDAYAQVDKYLTQPLLIIAGEEAESRWQSERLAELLEGKNERVEKVIVPGGRHMDFYDIEEYVGPAVQRIVDFFGGI